MSDATKGREMVQAAAQQMLSALHDVRAYDNHMIDHRECGKFCDKRGRLWRRQRMTTAAAFRAAGIKGATANPYARTGGSERLEPEAGDGR